MSMPIEVRELIIKATVSQETDQGKNAAPTLNNNASSNEAVINICVEKVLEILRDKHER